jgi:hypothetical protein
MEVVARRDDEEWQRHFEEEQRWQNLQEQANVGTFLSVMALNEKREHLVWGAPKKTGQCEVGRVHVLCG